MPAGHARPLLRHHRDRDRERRHQHAHAVGQPPPGLPADPGLPLAPGAASATPLTSPPDAAAATARGVSFQSRQILTAVAPRIRTPPRIESGLGFSPWISHVHTGLSAGSTNRSSETSNAVT